MTVTVRMPRLSRRDSLAIFSFTSKKRAGGGAALDTLQLSREAAVSVRGILPWDEQRSTITFRFSVFAAFFRNLGPLVLRASYNFRFIAVPIVQSCGVEIGSVWPHDRMSFCVNANLIEQSLVPKRPEQLPLQNGAEVDYLVGAVIER
jgi:hypothetical protein